MLFQFPALTTDNSQLPVTPALGAQMSFSGLCGHLDTQEGSVLRESKFHIRIQAGVVQLKISVKEESVAVSSEVT